MGLDSYTQNKKKWGETLRNYGKWWYKGTSNWSWMPTLLSSEVQSHPQKESWILKSTRYRIKMWPRMSKLSEHFYDPSIVSLQVIREKILMDINFYIKKNKWASISFFLFVLTFKLLRSLRRIKDDSSVAHKSDLTVPMSVWV